MATTALEEEKRKAIGYSFPQNVPEGGSIYRKRPLASDAKEQTSAGPGIGGLFPGISAVTSGSGQEMRDLVGRGQYGSAAGELARATTALIPAAADDFVNRPLAPVVNAIGSGLKQFVGAGDSSAPVQPSPTAKPAPSGTSLVTASQSQRGEGSMPATPAAPATTSQGLGIVRVDAPGASPLFTNLPTNDPSNVGLMARRAAPSAQNVGAMDALAGRYEANTTAQAQAMIDAEQAAASRMTPGQAYLQQAQASMPSFKGMTRLQAATAQQQFQEMNRVRGDAARLDQDAARTRQDAGLGMFRAQDEASTNDLRRKAVKADLDTKAQLDAARQEYLAAGDDPAKQKAAARKLAAFGIKDGQKEGGTWDSIVVGGGVNEQGMKVGGTAMLYNKSTGEARPIGEQQAQAGAKPAAPSLDVYLAEMRKANPGKNLSDAELKARYEMKFGAQQ